MKSSLIAQTLWIKQAMAKKAFFEPYSIPTGEERGREVGVQSVTEANAFDSWAKLEAR